ncbi:MAG: hypothetical protein ACTTKO_09820 [Candidatus Limimorpha sp.]
MKKNVFIVAVSAMFLLGVTSCVEKSRQYQALLAERDSIAMQYENVNNEFDSTMSAINEIEQALDQVRAAEGIIMVDNQEGNKKRALSQINALQNTLQENRTKIEDLEKRLNEQGSKSKALGATIARLKNEITEKDTFINNLMAEVQAGKEQITALNEQVTTLNDTIQTLGVQNAAQQAVIKTQDVSMNTVWYMAATSKNLVDMGILTKGGLFKSKKLQPQNFSDSNVFAQADRRTLTNIPLNTKKATIMTSHLEGSYNLVQGEDEMLTLEITNTEAFWKVSNYLVVMIK